MSTLSGLDWSGSAGDPRRTLGSNPRLVMVVSHILEDDLQALGNTLAQARKTLRLEPEFSFKHQGSAHRTRSEFFNALAEISFTAHALIIDKMTDRDADYFKRNTGPQQLTDAIVELMFNCPDRVIDKGTLLIDLPRTELNFIRHVRTTLRKHLRANDRQSFTNIRPCPDHRLDGTIVQVADMIAGELYERGSIDGPVSRADRAKREGRLEASKTPSLAGGTDPPSPGRENDFATGKNAGTFSAYRTALLARPDENTIASTATPVNTNQHLSTPCDINLGYHGHNVEWRCRCPFIVIPLAIETHCFNHSRHRGIGNSAGMRG